MLKENEPKQFDSVFKDDIEEQEDERVYYDFEKENEEIFNKTDIQIRAINEMMCLEMLFLENNGAETIVIKKEQLKTVHDLLEDIAKM